MLHQNAVLVDRVTPLHRVQRFEEIPQCRGPKVVLVRGDGNLLADASRGLATAVGAGTARADGIAASRNKMRSLQLLAAAGVPVPRTVMASDPSRLKEMVRLVGGVPVLVKLLSANERSGVMICESLQSLEAALEAILGLGQNIVVQQYLRGASGRDLRVLVVGGSAIAAMRRIPPVGRLAKNLRRGAQFERVDLPASYARTAIEATRVLRLEVSAVDMLDVKGGPRVFEVDPQGKTVWELTQADVPDVHLAFCGGFHRLPNGNTVLSNWLGHGQFGKGPHVLEVTPDKKVVWTYADHRTMRAVASVQVLDVPAKDELLH